MSRKIIIFIGIIFSSGIILCFAQEESITITTYYPSPYGSYNQLQTNSLGVGDNDKDGSLDSGDVPTTKGDVWIRGNVGIGTTNPGAKLDVNGQIEIQGGSPGAGKVLTSDAAGLATWQAPTAGSSISAGDSNVMVTDSGDGYITFTEDGREAMRITNGNVGIGTASPVAGVKLHLQLADLDYRVLRLQDLDGWCDANPEPGGVTWSCGSDTSLKENIADASSVLENLMKLKIREYTVKASGEREIGVIAQEVQEVMPELVKVGQDSLLEVSGVSSWKLIKAIQEQQDQIKGLKEEIRSLRAELNE